MHESIPDQAVVAGIYWLAFLLNGSENISVDITSDVLASASGNMRRAAILRSIAAQEGELRNSHDRYRKQTECDCQNELRAGLDALPDFVAVREALLAMELFPRYALLLTAFEGFSVRDAATCLDSCEQSIIDARNEGVLVLARNMTPALSL